MDLTSIMTDMLKDKAVDAIAEKTGLDSKGSKDMIAKALPMLLGALKTNANDSDKKESLENAVKNNDGSILDNLTNIDLEDGSKILGHIFGNKKEDVEKEVGSKDGLAALAPIIMGALGKANSDSGESASSLLSSDGMIMKMTTSFLDKDGDGDIKDDLLTMILKFLGLKKK